MIGTEMAESAVAGAAKIGWSRGGERCSARSVRGVAVAEWWRRDLEVDQRGCLVDNVDYPPNGEGGGGPTTGDPGCSGPLPRDGEVGVLAGSVHVVRNLRGRRRRVRRSGPEYDDPDSWGLIIRGLWILLARRVLRSPGPTRPAATPQSVTVTFCGGRRPGMGCRRGWFVRAVAASRPPRSRDAAARCRVGHRAASRRTSPRRTAERHRAVEPPRRPSANAGPTHARIAHPAADPSRLGSPEVTEVPIIYIMSSNGDPTSSDRSPRPHERSAHHRASTPPARHAAPPPAPATIGSASASGRASHVVPAGHRTTCRLSVPTGRQSPCR